MSTQKSLIKEPRKARRSFESVFAEAIITKACGWDVEFLSGGYDSYTKDELLFIIKTIMQITGRKQWLNLGVLNERYLTLFLPYVEGFTGTIECVNPELQKKVCPSKPVRPILNTFKICDKLGIKKGMTMIIGLGASIDDFPLLEKFIIENDLERVTFYSLNPQKGTCFTESPKLEYYTLWIEKTRKVFPNIEIIAGAWRDKTNYFSKLLMAGADYFTKFPALKYFGSKEAKEVENEIKLANMEFSGTLTKFPDINFDEEIERLDVTDALKKKIKVKLLEYLKLMRKNN
jgi:biotin synthase-like enzyme